jgi:hypothetical protein
MALWNLLTEPDVADAVVGVVGAAGAPAPGASESFPSAIYSWLLV